MMSSFPAITTEIIEAPTFFYAEDYHQQVRSRFCPCDSLIEKNLAPVAKSVSESRGPAPPLPETVTVTLMSPLVAYDWAILNTQRDLVVQYLAKPGSRLYCSAMPTAVSLGNDWVPADMAAKHKPRVPDAAWVINGPKQACSAAHGPNTTWAL